MTEGPSAPGGFGVGSRLAGYRLDEITGRGGMAVVYRAYDTRLERQVAVKVLAPELARSVAFRQRFIRESRTAAAVDHPNIIPIYEAGEASGVLFIAMRFVHGQDVQTLVENQGPLPVDQACHIISQVAAALEAAHSHGLVHRDVKPGNMLLDGSASYPGHAYLSDFGLSKHALSVSALTSTGQLLGTLDYIAPEQIEGRGVDGRTDEYALACSAFTMFTGAPPFARDESVAIMWAQMSSDPPPLTSRRPELPPAVDEVMAKALAKAPGNRYATCPAFAAELRRACGLELGTAGRPGPRPDRPERRDAGTPPPDHPATVAAAVPGLRPSGDEPEPGQVAGPAGSAGPGEPGAPEPPAQFPEPVPAREPAEPGQPVSAREPAEPDQPVSAREPAEPGQPVPTREPTEPGQPVPSWYPPPSRHPVPPTQREPAAAPGYGQDGPPGPPTEGVGPVTPEPAAPAGWQRRRPAAASAYPGASRVYPLPRQRPAWRSPVGIALVCAAVLAVGGYFLVSTVFPQSGGAGAGGSRSGAGPAAALTLPECTSKVATARQLDQVTSHIVTTGQGSFDVTVKHGHAYVSGGTGVTVLDASKSPPSVLWSSPLSSSQGETLTPDHQHLLVTDGDGIAVFSVSQLEQGAAGPVGTLSSPGQKHAVEVVVTPNGRFAFVTYQETKHVGVFSLQRAFTQGFGPADLVGLIPVPPKPIGIAMAPDGRHVYVTSTQSSETQSQTGVVNVIDVAKATAHPAASSILAKVPAGCGPSRVITSADGRQVWVTVSRSNALLGFDAGKMRTDPAHALLAKVGVGELPLGLIMVKDGTRIVVADSNRDKQPGAVSNLAVVDVPKALAGRPALLGYVQSGVTPRQFALTSHGNTLLVTNTDSGQLQAVSLSQVP